MIKNKFNLSILFVFLFISCLSFEVQAKQISIENLEVNAKLFKDGSLNIDENIEFKIDGEFNGVYRSIELNEASDIENINVSQITTSGEKEFKRVEKVENGDEGVYELVKKDNIYTLKLYCPSKDEKKVFRVKYKLIGAGVKYNDIGVFCYRFGREKNETKIDNFNMNLSIPDGAESSDLKVLIDKPLYNNKSLIVDKNNFNVKSEKIEEKIPIEIRFIFPLQTIPFSSNVRNENVLHRVTEEENRIKKALQYDENKREFINKQGNFASPIFIIVDIGLILFVLKKNRREKKQINFNCFPDQCTPAVASKLYMGNVKERDLVACILNLVRKNYLTFKKEEDDEYTIIKNKEVDEYLLKHEEFLINWFIRKIGDGFKVTSYEIKYYSSNSKEFLQEFNSWKYLVKEAFDDKNYFDKSAAFIGKIVIGICILQIVASIVFLFYGNVFHIANIIGSLFMVICTMPLFSRKNDYGHNETLKWREFKKYIGSEDYIKNRIIESTEDMDKYLVYALALGVNESVIEKINAEFKNKSPYYKHSCFYWYYNLNMYSHNNIIQNSITESFNYTSSADGENFSSDSGASSRDGARGL